MRWERESDVLLVVCVRWERESGVLLLAVCAVGEGE